MASVSDVVSIALVGGIGAGGYYIWKHKDDIGGFFGELGNSITDFFNNLSKGLGELGEDIGNGWKNFELPENPITDTSKNFLDWAGVLDSNSSLLKQFVDGSKISNPFVMGANLIGTAITEPNPVTEGGAIVLDTLGKVDSDSSTVEKFVSGSKISNPFVMGVELIGSGIDAIGGLFSSSSDAVTVDTPIKTTTTVYDPESAKAIGSVIKRVISSGSTSANTGLTTLKTKIEDSDEFKSLKSGFRATLGL